MYKAYSLFLGSSVQDIFIGNKLPVHRYLWLFINVLREPNILTKKKKIRVLIFMERRCMQSTSNRKRLFSQEIHWENKRWTQDESSINEVTVIKLSDTKWQQYATWRLSRVINIVMHYIVCKLFSTLPYHAINMLPAPNKGIGWGFWEVTRHSNTVKAC